MLLIQNISSYTYQQQELILPGGSSFLLQIRFSPRQLGWFIPLLTYLPVTESYGSPSNYTGPFTIQGLRITNSPNMLNQFRNQIPFGLACFSPSEREPTQTQDFSSGASNLYVLTQAECAQYAQFLALGSLL